MVFGSNTPEFVFQQGNTGTGHVPVRLPINFTTADERTITGIIMDTILSGEGYYSDMKRSSSGRKYYAGRDARGRFKARA
jgi:hypothetical protein